MIRIRREQLDVFETAARERAIARMAERLRIACAAATSALDDRHLRGEIEAGMAQAARYGIENELDVTIFLECRLDLGPDFDTRDDTAWASAILNDETLFGEEKASLLADRDRGLW
jgi:hypothetical protein